VRPHLTLAMGSISPLPILDGRHCSSSDHDMLHWVFSVHKQKQADNEQVIEWNPATLSKEDENATVKLFKALARETAHLGQEFIADDLR
jgi:hypothetical protein